MTRMLEEGRSTVRRDDVEAARDSVELETPEGGGAAAAREPALL
jgi:hypothetical protein